MLGPGDDIVAVTEKAMTDAGIEPQPDDILAICESPLAITQGRIRYLDEMKVGVAARILCRFFHIDSSIGTCYGMQAAIDEAGLVRVLLAFVLGSPTRLVGRRGDFYRLAGRQVAWLDDPPSALPPYTPDIVLGPHDPAAVARRAAETFGCHAAVVDANDLGTYEIMGASPGTDLDLLGGEMTKNPQGQSNEQTPIVLVRP